MKRIVIFSIVIFSLCFAGVDSALAADYSAPVQTAQRHLKALGYDPGPSDGLMGKKTTQAVRKFLQDRGLPATGAIDKKTEESLFSSLPSATQQPSTESNAAKGEKTLKAQQYLQQLGYNPGPADGKYGKRTETAIKNFQQDHGLPVTGMVGEQILKEMKTLLESGNGPESERTGKPEPTRSQRSAR